MQDEDWIELDSVGIDVGGPVGDLVELAAEVTRSRQLAVFGGAQGETFDLRALRPLIEPAYRVELSTLATLDHLAEAFTGTSVRELDALHGLSGRPQDLSASTFTEFRGVPTPSIASVLTASTLERVSLHGADPSDLPPLGLSVRFIDTWESPRFDRLPAMSDPASLRELQIRPSRRFELGSLAGCANLAKLTLMSVRDVRGIAELAGLPRLRELILDGCGTREDWSALLALEIEHVEIFGMKRPPVGFTEAARARGWSVDGSTTDDSSGLGRSDVEPFILTHDPDTGEWTTILTDFSSFDQVADTLDQPTLVNGHEVAAVLEAHFRAGGIDLEIDSEADQLDFATPDRASAIAVARYARSLLDSPAAIRRSLVDGGLDLDGSR